MKSVYHLDCPASDWERTIPIGNGRLGATVWGDPVNEMITLNEETIWGGGIQHRKNPDASHCMKEIRNLLLNGQVEKAQFLCQMGMTGTPKYIRPYQRACDMRFTFAGFSGEVKNYRRSLDMDRALTDVIFTNGGTRYTREYFVSVKYQVVAIRLRAEGSDRLTFQFNLNRRPFEEQSGGDGSHRIWLRGQCGNGVHYTNSALLSSTDGQILQLGDYLSVSNATEAVIFFDCETDFSQPDPESVCSQRLETAAAVGWEQIYQEHLTDYSRLYNTMSVQLTDADLSGEPMNQLLKRTDDSTVFCWLTQMLIAFGRYLLISSSYQCQLPANLQGIWCDSYTPRWESKYTININLQMNYWIVNSCGLEPCMQPFTDFMKRLCERGKSTARKIYGCRGSVAHHNTDCWANTDIEGLPASAYMWPNGEAWLALQLYDYYAYTLDREYLVHDVMPILKENVLFFYDYLYRAPDGHWLSGPSVSPENTYRTEDGQLASVTMAPTMDNQIIWELCTDYLKACSDLELDDDSSHMAREILDHLPPEQFTRDGRICEWWKDYEETEPGHRHISHLFGLYPGNKITAATPSLYEAAKKVLDTRLAFGGGHTGWSRVWLACLFARLHNASATAENLQLYIKQSTFENLFDCMPPHMPFQIDANFGFCAAAVECLAQSDGHNIEFLPAAPALWKHGDVKGLRLRGGLTVDMEWDESTLHCTLTSVHTGHFKLSCAGQAQALDIPANTSLQIVFPR